MLIKELPKIFFAEQLCRQAPEAGAKYEATLSFNELHGLKEELKGQKKPLHLSLIFSVDKAGFCNIRGELLGELQLICQRCMAPMALPIKSDICVSPVASIEQGNSLPHEYEPLLMENGEISLADWIAEELHLGLPLVPRHEPPCEGGSEVSAPSEDDGKLNVFREALLKLKDVK